MSQFLSCDWGTTAFRLRLVETNSLEVLAEESSNRGIAESYQQWKQTGGDEKKRVSFYLNIISGYISLIAERTGFSLHNIPLIISGMASSTIGMIELPYRELPVSVNGSDLHIECMDENKDFQHKTVIISGLKTADDVMRGEETKLVGSASSDTDSQGHIYIFPGTHPKHIEVKDGQIKTFKTYMTGEVFSLLSAKSILSVSVAENREFHAEKNIHCFEKGVRESIHSNLLHSCFLVRTNQLFKKLSPEENYHYLSGLLIGNELKDLAGRNLDITVVGSAALSQQYLAGLNVLGLPHGALLSSMDADEALIKGQSIIYKKVCS